MSAGVRLALVILLSIAFGVTVALTINPLILHAWRMILGANG